MKKGYACVCGTLLAGAFSAGAGEEIDWGQLADYWLAVEVKSGTVTPEEAKESAVVQGTGGIRVEMVIVGNEKDRARMRKVLEVIERQPDPRPKKKPVKIWRKGEVKGIIDPFDGIRGFQKGDWNQGKPFVGTGAKAKPRG